MTYKLTGKWFISAHQQFNIIIMAYKTFKKNSKKMLKGFKKKMKAFGFKKRLAKQKSKSKKYNSFRVSRGGIRL